MGAIQTGAVIGDGYTLKEKMGTTSLGELYLAENKSGEEVRIEVLSGENADDPEKVQRLLHEIELIAAMDHPNVAKAMDAGQDGDVYFLVTVHEPGQSLEALLKDSGGKLPEKQALGIAADVASALNYAWTERKILHRDIKPSAIYVTDEGVAKLLGFGIAKSTDSPQSMGLTGAGFTIGTPEYMSPEQIRAEGDLDFRSDLYAVGCVLYQMCAGNIPFDDSAPILIMHKHMDEDPEPVDGISEDSQALIMQMLAKDKADRHESWNAAINEMKRIAASDPQPATAAAPKAAPEPGAPSFDGGAEQASKSAAAPAPAAADTGGGSPIGMIIGVVVVVIVVIIAIAMMGAS